MIRFSVCLPKLASTSTLNSLDLSFEYLKFFVTSIPIGVHSLCINLIVIALVLAPGLFLDLNRYE